MCLGEEIPMMSSTRVKTIVAVLLLAGLQLGGAAMAQDAVKQPPIVVERQGSFAVGGTVLQTPGTYNNNAPTAAGQSFHGDHLYAFYQVPQNPKPCRSSCCTAPIQSARSWETTSDGREGFQTHLPAPRLRGLSGRPAAPRPRRQQHGGRDHRADAL